MILLRPRLAQFISGYQYCTIGFTPLSVQYSSSGRSVLHVQFYLHITTFPSGDQRCLFSFTLMSLLLLRTICVARVPSCYCCSSDDQCFTCSVSPSCNHLFLRAISVARAVLPSCMCAPFRRSVPSADQRGLFSFTLMSLPLAGLPSRGGDVADYVFDINQPSLPTPSCSVLVSISVFMALSTVFHSINSPNNSLLSHSVLPVLFLPHWYFQVYISL